VPGDCALQLPFPILGGDVTSPIHVGGRCPLDSPHSVPNPPRASMLSAPVAGRLWTCSVPRRHE
jgi:hypothetical protein